MWSSTIASVVGCLVGGRRVERRHAIRARFDHRDFAVVEIDGLLRVAHQRGRIRRHEHLLVADAENHRTTVARDDDLLGVTRVHHRDSIRAGDRPQRRAHRVFERIRFNRRNQLRQHFRIGFRFELHAARFELHAQFVRVFDDAVVDHCNAAGHIGLRVRVAVARRAVRRPSRMANTHHAGKALRQRSPPFRAPCLVACAPRCRSCDATASPGRVVAAVLEAVQSLDENRYRILMSHVTDDSAHRATLREVDEG